MRSSESPRTSGPNNVTGSRGVESSVVPVALRPTSLTLGFRGRFESRTGGPGGYYLGSDSGKGLESPEAECESEYPVWSLSPVVSGSLRVTRPASTRDPLPLLKDGIVSSRKDVPTLTPDHWGFRCRSGLKDFVVVLFFRS